MKKYYVMPTNTVLKEWEKPFDMTGVIEVDLPNGDYLEVTPRNKKYPAYKVALAIARGQINIEDVR